MAETYAELVREVAATHTWPHPLTDDDIEHILWEETSWPTTSHAVVERQLHELFGFLAIPEPRIHGGPSWCPMCGRRWWVTPRLDCLVPACGCFGSDTSAANTERPCHGCGLAHALRCHRKATASG